MVENSQPAEEQRAVPDCLASEIIDMHAHFFPPPLMQAIWRYFEKRSWAQTLHGGGQALALSTSRYATDE